MCSYLGKGSAHRSYLSPLLSEEEQPVLSVRGSGFLRGRSSWQALRCVWEAGPVASEDARDQPGPAALRPPRALLPVEAQQHRVLATEMRRFPFLLYTEPLPVEPAQRFGAGPGPGRLPSRPVALA